MDHVWLKVRCGSEGVDGHPSMLRCLFQCSEALQGPGFGIWALRFGLWVGEGFAAMQVLYGFLAFGRISYWALVWPLLSFKGSELWAPVS